MRPCATSLESELSPKELDLLLSTIRKNTFPGKHLEIGTAAGGTLWRMINARCSAGQRPSPAFVVVDPMTYFRGQLDTVKKNLAIHDINPLSVDFRVSTSDRAFRLAAKNGERFDFIFIDGAHKIKHVMADLRWARLLNPNGILMLHDYEARTPAVTLPVKRFLKKYPNYAVLGQADTLIALRKKTASRRREISAMDRLYALMLSPVLQMKASWEKWRKKLSS
jgi:predicted O-methyltransferase YrrM